MQMNALDQIKEKTNRRIVSESGICVTVMVVVLAAHGWGIWRSPAYGLIADQGYHLALAEEYEGAWKAGEFPPRWAAGMNGGRGAPTFVVYPPFLSFLTVSLNHWMGSIRSALGAAVLVVVAGGFWAVFYLARAWMSPIRSAIAGAAVMLLPGTTMLWGLGMYPNYGALPWLGLAAGAGQRIVLGNRTIWNTAVLATGMIGLILTHAMTAFLITFLAVILSPLLWKAGWPALCRFLVAAAVTLVLTGWFWIPLLESGRYTRVEFLEQSHRYRESAIGGPSSESNRGERYWKDINSTGKAIVIAQSILACFIFLALKDRPEDCGKTGKGEKTERRPILFLELLPWLVLACFLLAVDPVAGLLVQMPGFGIIQFSWRWQILVSLWCGVSLASLGWRGTSFIAWICGGLVLALSSTFLAGSDARLDEISKELPAAISLAELNERESLVDYAYRANSLELRPRGADWNF